jgi:hypothetical protein
VSEPRWRDGTPIHGSLREAAMIWVLMAASLGAGIVLGLAIAR